MMVLGAVDFCVCGGDFGIDAAAAASIVVTPIFYGVVAHAATHEVPD